MRNAKIAMGEERIKVAIRPKSAPGTVVELEITDRDAAAANRALELLGKTDEVRLFVEVNELTGKKGGPIETADARDKAVKDHLEGLSKRFAAGLKLIEGDKNVDHLEGLSQRYANGSKALNGGASDEDALDAASVRRLQEHRRRGN
jgi:hypothetical protein